METDVQVALVAALSALVVSLLGVAGGIWTAARAARTQSDLEDLKAHHKRLEVEDARVFDALSELDRHREPLLLATLDLAHRIRNIREDRLLEVYLHGADTRRSTMTELSTLYRFARYWCVVESLYDDVRLTAFEASDATKDVAASLRDIGRTFADDLLDDGRLMMWREEQRAVAERMRPGRAPMLGYASFVQLYDRDFAPWFEHFAAGLHDEGAARADRLSRLQSQLAVLARQLDTTGTFSSQWRGLGGRATT